MGASRQRRGTRTCSVRLQADRWVRPKPDTTHDGRYVRYRHHVQRSFPSPVAAPLPPRDRRRARAALAGVPAGLRPGIADAGRRGRGRQHASAAAGHRVLLERRRADSLVGQGQRRLDGARAGPAADAAVPRGHGVRPGPLQPDGPGLDEPAPRTHESAVGRDRSAWTRTRSASARRWIRSSRRRSAGARRFRAWCWASSRTSCGSKTGSR